MTLELLAYSVSLFVSLFVIGTLLCLKLYRWEYVRFFRSTLWTKVYYWVPIFFIFLVVLYVQIWAALFIVSVIVIFAIREIRRQPRKGWSAWLYAFVVAFALAHIVLFFEDSRSISVLLVVGFSSVLSDVCAYFFGNFIGRHKLPVWINSTKSWEGVTGQLVGAIFGFLLMSPAIHPSLHISLAIIIGLASAVGDVLNSIVKRRMSIKDWGMTIPGHGGVLDRFSSLSFAIMATYWWIVLLQG